MAKQDTPPEAEILSRVTVRLIESDERDRFDQLLEEQHYRQSARLGGRSLRYVAELDWAPSGHKSNDGLSNAL